MKHTREPWGIALNMETGFYELFNDGAEEAIKLTEANAERIVACVNFCKGASNETLNSQTLHMGLQNMMLRRTEEDENVKQQRDKLLEGMKEFIKVVNFRPSHRVFPDETKYYEKLIKEIEDNK